MEFVEAHVDFTPHGEMGRRMAAGLQVQRQGADRAEIDRDVFACRAVSSGRPPKKDSSVIDQFYREAVEFWFHRVADLVCLELPLHPLIERHHILPVDQRV